MEELLVRVHVSAEGTLMYDVYLDPPDADLPEDSDDGGECTSGSDKPDVPHSAADWRNALEMAVDGAIALIEKKH